MLNLKIIQHLADNKPVRVIFLIMIEKKKKISINFSVPMPFSIILLLPSSEDMLTALHSLDYKAIRVI